jgi:hypothetical protein
VAVKDDDVDGGSSSALEEAFKFGWDQEDNDWDGSCPPIPLIGCWIAMKRRILIQWMFFGLGTSPGLGLKEEGLGIRAKGSWQILKALSTMALLVRPPGEGRARLV